MKLQIQHIHGLSQYFSTSATSIYMDFNSQNSTEVQIAEVEKYWSRENRLIITDTLKKGRKEGKRSD